MNCPKCGAEESAIQYLFKCGSTKSTQSFDCLTAENAILKAENEQLRETVKAKDCSNDEWASDCQAISEACGIPFLDEIASPGDGNAEEVIDYIKGIKDKLKVAGRLLVPFAKVAEYYKSVNAFRRHRLLSESTIGLDAFSLQLGHCDDAKQFLDENPELKGGKEG